MFVFFCVIKIFFIFVKIYKFIDNIIEKDDLYVTKIILENLSGFFPDFEK